MKRTTIAQLYQTPNNYKDIDITVCGWVRSLRDSKSLGFIDLNDGSCFKGVQVVFEETILSNYKEIAKQNVGTALCVTGTFVLTPDAKQPFELHAKQIHVEGASSPEYPLQKRVFLYAHTPFITGSDCEGAGEMFRVTTLELEQPPKTEQGNIDYTQDFFQKPTSLTVSGQLEGECMAMAFGNIYTFGPTFRAEHSNTQRHAAEFWMIEPEIAFADLQDVMLLAQDLIKFIISFVMETCPDDLAFFNQFVDKGLLERLNHIVTSEFACISYTNAIEQLQNCGAEFEYPVAWGIDLQTEHERYLTEQIFKKPVFVTDYPKEIKAFYMRLNDDGKTVAAMDLLVPGIGEIIGGSQREERLDLLRTRMQEAGLKEEDYWWYLDLRRFGGTKHAGFGLGFERMVMYLTGISNIRDVLPFPRTTGNAEF